MTRGAIFLTFRDANRESPTCKFHDIGCGDETKSSRQLSTDNTSPAAGSYARPENESFEPKAPCAPRMR